MNLSQASFAQPWRAPLVAIAVALCLVAGCGGGGTPTSGASSVATTAPSGDPNVERAQSIAVQACNEFHTGLTWSHGANEQDLSAGATLHRHRALTLAKAAEQLEPATWATLAADIGTFVQDSEAATAELHQNGITQQYADLASGAEGAVPSIKTECASVAVTW